MLTAQGEYDISNTKLGVFFFQWDSDPVADQCFSSPGRQSVIKGIKNLASSLASL